MMLLLCSVAAAGAETQHWIATPNETIWHGEYTNCDYGYAVGLPTGVIAHSDLPPSPNHGFLISAADPATIQKVGLENQRLVDVYAEYDALGLGGARAYLKWELQQDRDKKILQIKDIMFQGLRAVRARYRVNTRNSSGLIEQLILFRKSAGIVYVIMLRTTARDHAADSELFTRLQAGFHLLPIPKGQCLNP